MTNFLDFVNRRGASAVYDARYMLRPETLESIFLAYRLTGDPRYREVGWNIFQSIQKYCRLNEGGYATILNVDDVNTRRDDKMETFWLVRPSSFAIYNQLRFYGYTGRNFEVSVPLI
jgi:hypothetical protein